MDGWWPSCTAWSGGPTPRTPCRRRSPAPRCAGSASVTTTIRTPGFAGSLSTWRSARCGVPAASWSPTAGWGRRRRRRLRRHREVLVLHYLADLPVEEIGRVLKIPAGTVKGRLFRARSALERELGEARPTEVRHA